MTSASDLDAVGKRVRQRWVISARGSCEHVKSLDSEETVPENMFESVVGSGG